MACYGNPASTPRLRARACTHPFVAGITAAVIGVDTAFHSLAFSPTGRRSETPCIPNAEKPKRLREGGLFRKMLVLCGASLILRHWVGGSVQSLGRVGVSASPRWRERAAGKAGREPLMTQLDRTADIARMAVDRTRSGRHGGSVGLVLFVAVVLAGAGAGLILVGRANAEPHLLALLARMAMAGLFLLLALAAGLLRVSRPQGPSPILKSLVARAPG